MRDGDKMDQFALSSLLQFTNGVSIEYDPSDMLCGYWATLQTLGLLDMDDNVANATDEGLRLIELVSDAARIFVSDI